MVKIADIVNEAFNIMKDSVPQARLEAELLTAYVTGKDRLYVAVHKDDCIEKEKAMEISRISTLRAEGMPFAYITEKKEFMSLEFSVNRNVLIPRPETEELVSLAIKLCKDKGSKILDLCTGSGAIAVSCAYYLPDSVCHGVDICREAINTAKQNAKNLKVENRTDFWEYDVLINNWNYGIYDVVISNPPYIESDTVDTLDTTVKSFEPRLALDGGKDGLVFYKKIIENIEIYLKKNGIILFEIGYNQGNELKILMEPKFKHIEILKDYSGKDRIVYGILA